jgi:hypothetical protein
MCFITFNTFYLAMSQKMLTFAIEIQKQLLKIKQYGLLQGKGLHSQRD